MSHSFHQPGDSPGDPVLRARLIEAAAGLLATGPVSAITTRQIARSAGLSVGVLYNYFTDKNGLLVEALLVDYRAKFVDFETRLPSAGSGTVEENLEAFARSIFELANITLPVVAGLVSDPDLMHRFLIAIHGDDLWVRRTMGRISEYLTEEQRLGRLGSFEVDSASTVLVGSMIALGIGGTMGGQSEAVQRQRIPIIVRTLLDGLK